MGSQTKDSDSAPQSPQRTFMEDLIVTFSSPMAWLLMIALIITWAGVAIVLFDLLDYTTLAEYTSYCDDPKCLSPGLPPPSSIGKRGMKARAARPLKAAVAAAAASAVASEESSDWLQSLWSLVARLVAPEDEEEGIHQLTDPFTSFHSEEL
ncbi:triadin isoform X2 [Periophthalmus magnuspinnatus]|uniref:triadin isoform X2 n=1 Tax=Periophthalmus magnuspinnatus TaxID=409849 RepID=UPI002436E4EF|nr:triadin isoform X2 [Periophthalmus magnuspinnatus]